MSNELISALETRVTSAVDTIEGLRSELRVLREERQLLEDKLRELLHKIDGIEGTAQAASSEMAQESQPSQSTGFGSNMMGTGSPLTDY